MDNPYSKGERCIFYRLNAVNQTENKLSSVRALHA